MSAHCCAHGPQDDSTGAEQDARYRRVLWVALGINAGMFLVEVIAGLAAGSVSLQADALDFLADAGNYGISLFVVGMALRHRARASFIKGLTSAQRSGIWSRIRFRMP
jgi:Co/Zn/Cd efflux system component